MNKTKKTYALTALVLFTAFPTYIAQTRDDNGTRLAIGIIGGVAGAVGLYGAYNWLCGESDEEAMATARQRAIECKNEYREPIAMQAGQYVDRLDEKILCELAKIKHSKPTISVYLSQVDSALRDLRSSYNTLSKRIVDQRDYMVRDCMQQVVSELRTLIEEMDLFSRTLKTHQSYFDLYEAEKKLAFKYDEELIVLASYNGNLDNQAWAIRQFVIARSKTSSLPFPRVEYRKIVDRDIERLESIFNKSSRHYPERMAYMRQLIDTLKLIKSFLVTDVLYPQEVVNYEHDQREKERIRIERDKADAARRKAEAEECKARAERDRVRLEEQKILERRKENRLKEKELAQKERQERQQQYQGRYGY